MQLRSGVVSLLVLALLAPLSALAMNLDSAVQAARDDAARRTGAAPSQMQLVSSQRVTWRDSSLGCPDAGMMYTQQLVPGFRVRLRVKGAVLDYHASESGSIVLCPADRAVDPLPDASR
jgi:hypothetical protein